MLVEVGAVGEGARAVRAAEGALAGVQAQVLEQRPALGEGAAAGVAAVGARARLAPHVRGPGGALGEALAAAGAGVRAQRGVAAQVQAVLGGRGEAPRTLRALERLLARVDALVLGQVALLAEALAARAARVRLLPCAHTDTSCYTCSFEDGDAIYTILLVDSLLIRLISSGNLTCPLFNL